MIAEKTPYVENETVVFHSSVNVKRQGRICTLNINYALYQNDVLYPDLTIPSSCCPAESIYGMGFIVVDSSSFKNVFISISTAGKINAVGINADGTTTSYNGRLYGSVTWQI